MGSPLARCVIAALLAAGAALVLHAALGGGFEVTARAGAVLLAAGFYTHLFEHAWHRWGMHGRRYDPRHARHHRLFHGKSFQTRDPAKLEDVTTSWYIFPALLAAHYGLFAALFPAPLAPAFAIGVTLQYLFYEVTHWYTHVEANGFDRMLSRTPGLRGWRARQIEHHRLHHSDPGVNFNFTPPYAGDRFGGVKRAR